MQTLGTKKLLILALCFAALTLFFASLYIKAEKEEFVINTQLKISEQETTLAAIAELTDHDGADAVVERIIRDCSIENRDRFDTLLSKLALLRGSELAEIEKLFDACGNFYAERKAVMVARFEREFEVYSDFIELLAVADTKTDRYEEDKEAWGSLVTMEKERSELSTRLVSIQGEIIVALRAGTSVSSDGIQTLLVEAQQIKDRLVELGSQIDQKRQEILSL